MQVTKLNGASLGIAVRSGPMGLVAKGGRNEDTKLAGTSQNFYMDPCSECGAPVSMVAATKPDPFLCPACTTVARAKAAASAAAADGADAETSE